MSDWDVFNGYFFLSLAAAVFAFAGVVMRMCLRSQCDRVHLCCIDVHRNIPRDVPIPPEEDAV